jgi:hypothetical protein
MNILSFRQQTGKLCYTFILLCLLISNLIPSQSAKAQGRAKGVLAPITFPGVPSNEELARLLKQDLAENGQSVPAGYSIVVDHSTYKDKWAIIAYFLTYGEIASGGGALGIAQLENVEWHVVSSANPAFNNWLSELPNSLLSEDAKLFFRIEPLQQSSVTALSSYSGHKLPWQGGVSYEVRRGVGGHPNPVEYWAYDFAMANGTEIWASYSGTVVHVTHSYGPGTCNPDLGDQGNRVVVNNDDGSASLYLHLQQNGARVSVGQRVKQGDLIGLSGNSGYVCGSGGGYHLHFQVQLQGSSWWTQSQQVIFNPNGEPAVGSRPISGNYRDGSCPTVSGVARLFDLQNCGGSLIDAKVGLTKLDENNFNDKAESIAIPSGWSARLYQNNNENINESACFTSTDANLNDNKYANGGTVGGTVTWVRVYDNSNCGGDRGRWHAEYFPNPDWSGSPQCSEDFDGPNFSKDWGSGAPCPGMSGDNFTARFTGKFNFPSTRTYWFDVDHDDGATLIIDKRGPYIWQSSGHDCPSETLDAGDHDLSIDYKENTGSAHISLEVLDHRCDPRPRPPAGFIWCADEDNHCNFNFPPDIVYNTAEVVYGALDSFTSPRSFTTGVDCNNGVFGDPIAGQRKACYFKPPGSTPCANEGEACSFGGDKIATVYYGVYGKYNAKTGVLSSTPCDNGTFGDPYPGPLKACYYVITGSNIAPPSNPSPADNTTLPRTSDTDLSWSTNVTNCTIHIWGGSIDISPTNNCSSLHLGEQRGGAYNWQVTASNGSGGSAMGPIWHFNIKPYTPTNLNITSSSATEVTLNWTLSNDEPADIDEYHIYQNGQDVGSVTKGISTYTVRGLTCDGSYDFYVKSKRQGVLSEVSNTVTRAAVECANVIDRDLDIWNATYFGFVSDGRFERWRFELTKTHSFVITASPILGGLVPKLTLFDANNNQLAQSTNTLTSTQPAGTYYIQVQPESGSGIYSFTIREITDLPPSVSTSVKPSRLNLGESALVTVSLNNVLAEGYSSAEFTCVYDNWGVTKGNIIVDSRFGADPVWIESPQLSIPEISSFIVAIAGSNGAKATTSGPVFTFGLTAQQALVDQISIECKARVSKGDGKIIDLPSTGPVTLRIDGGTITPTASQTPTPTGSHTPTVTATFTETPTLTDTATVSTPTDTATPTGSVPPTDTPTPTSTVTATQTATTQPPGILTGRVIACKPVAVVLRNPSGQLVTSVNANPDDGDGTFTVKVPAGEYIVEADAKGFLWASTVDPVIISSGGTTTLPAVTLLPGDIFKHDILIQAVIDEWDAMTIGMNYNGSTPTDADLNCDGIINFLDLELLAKNFRMTGPVAWQ